MTAKRRLNLARAPLLVLASLLLGAAGGLRAQGPVDFEKQVLPTLKASCFKCHGPARKDRRGRMQQPKAGLRLDGRAWIEKGSENGPVIVPGKPEESLLLTLTTLPADDPDIMPARGATLTRNQTDAIRAWIAGGASFGTWTGVPGPAGTAAPGGLSPKLPSSRRAALLERLAKGAPARSDAALAKAVGPDGRATRLGADRVLLRVEFTAFEDAVDDRRVKALAPLGAVMCELDLGRTRVTDAALSTLGRMKRLVRLDLHDTDVGDAGLERLAALPELRVLNLYGTKITDAGLKHLARLKSLERLYVWQTAVTAKGIAALRQSRPGLKIVHTLALPDPPPPSTDDRRRRRRR